MSSSVMVRGRGIVPGTVAGMALVGPTSVPGWNAFDLSSGIVLEKGNVLCGQSIRERVLILNGARGSTAWATQFHQARVAGVGPAALVFPRVDSRVANACIVSQVPTVADLERDIFQIVNSGDWVSVDGDEGVVIITPR